MSPDASVLLKSNIGIWLPILVGGALLVCVAGYTQWMSMDLGAWSLVAYLRQDVVTVEWWRSVGVPLAVGVALLVVAIAIRSHRASPQVLYILTGSVVLIAIFSRVVVLAGIILVLVAVVAGRSLRSRRD